MPQLNPAIAVAWQSEEHGWWNGAREAASTASRAHGTPSSESSSVSAPAQQRDLARISHNFALLLPAAQSLAMSCMHPFSSLCPCTNRQCKGRIGETRVCKREGKRDDPTLPHPRTGKQKEEQNWEEVELQASQCQPVAPRQLWAGEKRGAEQGWDRCSLRQQRLPCCATWLGLLSSQLT